MTSLSSPVSAAAAPKEYRTFAMADNADICVELQANNNDHDVEEGAVHTDHNTVYDAAAIRSEFQAYHARLPKPDQLLQQQHSVDILRGMISQQGSSSTKNNNNNNNNSPLPRFLQHASEGGIKPHNALCCLLLDDFQAGTTTTRDEKALPLLEVLGQAVCHWSIWLLSAGRLHPQLHLPSEVIRDQFYAIASHVMTQKTRTDVIGPDVLRHTIRNQGLPVPNFFLDPEDPKQFPPHIALLVILQDGQKESRHLQNRFHRLAWLVFAAVALMLRLVLEVIGGAGAIWGGSEVFHLRKNTATYNNNELWRWISIAVGICCFLRFVTLNAPQQEDEGDILGPAGPWSLRTAARLRAVCEHPFHYFCRAQAPHPAIANASRRYKKS